MPPSLERMMHFDVTTTLSLGLKQDLNSSFGNTMVHTCRGYLLGSIRHRVAVLIASNPRRRRKEDGM